MSVKQRMPFLRWSFLRWSLWRAAWGMPGFAKRGQIGDGREAACAEYVEANARRGDLDDVLATIDTFGYEKSVLMNVGDEKGVLLDAAVRRANPSIALELGTYCGYGSLRIARTAPSARCIRSSSRRPTPKWPGAFGHTPVSTTGSPAWWAPSPTAARRSTHWPTSTASRRGSWICCSSTNDKSAYLSDLQSILDRGWLHPGSIAVADNVRVPGAPR
jgi:catechol O-methyltransferase